MGIQSTRPFWRITISFPGETVDARSTERDAEVHSSHDSTGLHMAPRVHGLKQ